MIARLWHGITPSSKADDYLDTLNKTGVRECRATPGNRGVYVLRRIDAGVAHFLFISLWDAMDASERFAGAEVDRARYYPGDREFLLEFEPTVTHRET